MCFREGHRKRSRGRPEGVRRGAVGPDKPGQRGEHIRRLGEVLERRRAEIAGLVVAEAGIPSQYADPVNVEAPIDRLLPTSRSETP